MKLSEYQGEEALDLLADLIEPAGEIMSDKEIGEVFKENRFRAIGLAIKNHKKAANQKIAAKDGVPAEAHNSKVTTVPAKKMGMMQHNALV